MQSYNFTKNKHSNKKVKKIEESRVRCQHFHLYFHLMIFTNNFYYFDLKTQYEITVISPLTGNNQWTKWHSLWWLSLMTHGIQKVAMDLCISSSQVLVLEKVLVPLNSAYVSVEYKQILQSYLGE